MRQHSLTSALTIALTVTACSDPANETDVDLEADHGSHDSTVRVTEGLTAVGNGFYYPVDGSISGNANWLACGSSYVANVRHIGSDLIRSSGTPVFAVGGGTVIARSGPAQSSGWGKGLYALAIQHQSAAGAFVAIYGHIVTSLAAGSSVTAGQQVGTIGNYYEVRSDGSIWDGADHLHFGVRPGTTISGPWGRISDAGCTSPGNVNGFVAPVSYLLTNTPPGSTAIGVGSTVTGSVGAGGQKKYSFSITSGQRYTVTLVPASGDPDLYTSNSSGISTSNYQCRPYLGGLQIEACTFIAPWTGTNYALIHGYTAAGYSLKVTSP